MEYTDLDDLIEDAVRITLQYGKVSSALLQRRLSIGYARAARIMDQLEYFKIISRFDGVSKPRKVLIKSIDEFYKMDIKKRNIEDKTKDSEIKIPIEVEPEIFPRLSQITLYITVALMVIGLFRIQNHDLKILYSLGMIIASSICKYGTNISFYTTKCPKDYKNVSDRWWPYVITWLFGLYGLIF